MTDASVALRMAAGRLQDRVLAIDYTREIVGYDKETIGTVVSLLRTWATELEKP